MDVSLVALVGCFIAGTQDPDFSSRHDMVWEVAPVKWNTGVPLANGHIGALVWGDGNPLKITLDKYDAWETREKDLDLTYAELRRLVREKREKEAESCMRTEAIYQGGPYPTRLPMPRAELTFDEPFQWRSGRLVLSTATFHLEGTVGGTPVVVTITVHADRNVIMVKVNGEKASQAQLRVSFRHLSEDARHTLQQWGYDEPVVTADTDGGSLVQTTPGGYEYAVVWQQTSSDATRTFALALQANTDDPEPLATARKLTQDFVERPDLSAHEAWWRDYWSRSSISLPDPRFEALYYIEMYKLACSSRPGGLPITLQGLWTLDGGLPPWSGDYHLDMNVQQSYWPIYAANRLELGEPLYRTFSACIPRWRKQCQEFFGFDGIWAGCAIGPKGERIFGYSGVELWPGNAAWLSHHYWLHFLYSQDKVFLEEQALPMMRLAFLTYANLLERGDDGKLHVPLSYSPEYYEGSFRAYAADPVCDLALIRFLGKALLESNRILGTVRDITPRIEEVLVSLVDYPRDATGLLVSAGQGLDHSHRHHSHLMAIHPLGILNVEDGDAEKTLIQQSLRTIRTKGVGEWTGWAFPWMSLIASRAGYGNMAWQMLDTYANLFITPNTFHINGDPRIFGLSQFDYEPMTLEAGFGAAAALMEMLLQSHGGVIRLFPSTPDRWHDAAFCRLRAEGAFVVSAQLVKNEVTHATIVSDVGGLCRVKNPTEGLARLTTAGMTRDLTGDVLEFETLAGESYLLEWGRRDDSTESAISSDLNQNFFGVKRHPRY